MATVRGVALLLLPTWGCQWIGDIGERRVSEGAGACELPPAGATTARVGNLVPASSEVAFCMKPADGGPTTRLPLAVSGCPEAMGYEQFSTPAGVEPGAYQVRVVASADGCDGAPLAEADLTIQTGGNTLAWLGGGARTPLVIALPESPAPGSGYLVRMAHAAPAFDALGFGIASAGGIPAKITAVAFDGVQFGQTSASVPGIGSADGYIGYVSGVDAVIGAAPAPAAVGAPAVIAARIPFTEARFHALTLWAVGGEAGEPPRALICDETESNDGYTVCSRGLPIELRAEAFAAGHLGAGQAYGPERFVALRDSIASFDSDVLCVQEAWPAELRDELAAAASSGFPHQVAFDYDFTTPFSKPEDLNGDVPPPDTEPACGAADATAMHAMLDCLRDECATPSAEEGKVPDLSCATTVCGQGFVELLAKPKCGICVLYTLAGETIGETRTICSSVAQPFVFGGASGSVLLSRHPIEEPSGFLSPSTWFRREVLHGRVRMPNGSALDVYCAYSPPIPQIPIYTGIYGAGATGEEAWRNERRLHLNNLVEWINQTQRAPRALLLGHLGTAPELESSVPVEPDDYALLTSHFPLAVPPGYVPECTTCTDNPLAPPQNHFGLLALLRGEAIVVAAERTRTEPIVSVTPPGSRAPVSVPLSAIYGFRTTLRLAQ